MGQPVLYRLFGDKAGLLSALVDHGFDRYVQRKQALATTDDPSTTSASAGTTTSPSLWRTRRSTG